MTAGPKRLWPSRRSPRVPARQGGTRQQYRDARGFDTPLGEEAVPGLGMGRNRRDPLHAELLARREDAVGRCCGRHPGDTPDLVAQPFVDAAILFSLAREGTGMCDVVFRFARDSPLEGDGFEPSVPGDKPWVPSWKMLRLCRCQPAGYPTVRCGDVRFRALVKGSTAWLLCLPVGQASSLASSCRSTLFLAHPARGGVFRRGANGSNPSPSSGESGANLAFGGASHR